MWTFPPDKVIHTLRSFSLFSTKDAALLCESYSGPPFKNAFESFFATVLFRFKVLEAEFLFFQTMGQSHTFKRSSFLDLRYSSMVEEVTVFLFSL